jgi:H+-transporting ATPase
MRSLHSTRTPRQDSRLPSLPWSQMLVIIVYAMFSCLVVNDAVKVVMIRRLVPASVA